ncbi:SCP-like protein [Ancylostoma duodenale]|uniref:SCP-like protein n=1 Tax=Ancylostoma duodenale TaxID=51022 RepID=A0A0C2D7G0_9BILA|nr:SCP-like protein [Ancylostoma duodenale]
MPSVCVAAGHPSKLCKMVNLLLVLLCVGIALSQGPVTVCTNDPQDADVVRTEFLKGHNKLRKDLIDVKLVQDDEEKLPGSKNMFKITYDCFLEGLALTTLSGCPSKPKLDFINTMGGEKSVNYAVIRGIDTNNPPQAEADYVPYIKTAVADWVNYMYEDNLDIKTVAYKNAAMEPFANMIYNKTIAVGCSPLYCADKKRVAVSCVYNAKPKLNEPLYEPAKVPDGCTSAGKRCDKVVKGSECIKDGDPDVAFKGLCRTALKEIPSEFSSASLVYAPPRTAH